MPFLNPITAKRLRRFRRIKRGYYSFVVLMTLTIISLFSNYVANKRAIVVSYADEIYFPTFRFYDMATFGQEDEYGFDDVEADYLGLQARFEASDDGNWLWMPVVPFDPYEPDFNYDKPPPNAPDSRHWFGTDSQGRDVFARLLYGFRISIFFAVALVFSGQLIGTIIGALQGFLGGRFDILSQRFIEVWSTLPFLYVVILLATFFKPSFILLLVIMGLFEWIRMTFYMRTEIYREKTKEYCLAARSFGASRRRLILKHLLPNCLTPLVTITPFAIVGAISALTALDYLGYGLPAPTPSWGEMIDQAMDSHNRDKIWLSIAPFSAISLTLLLVTMIGESIREAFDPKQYAHYR
ncbi:MAG: ABC transporter permease subunit [Gemmatimonadetes bacterium]|jgi:microcin C transport system permease protein|nr:ABC transporter permease subunit [Gemmatimonadota bacterium]MBT6148610.1 ABC transporter permease subunit [Gemmatimonadota bacterium]MBT7859508.1 ABC transporter permease subunit [Gemmatimonadota bacterium]